MANSKPQPVEETKKPAVETPASIHEEEIAQRAYELFVARGGEHGHDLEDWLEAERSLQKGAAA